MKYRVHRLNIEVEKDHLRLEEFLNRLEGEVVSIIPNIAKTTLFQFYGGSSKVNFLLIIEKIA